MLVRAGSRSLPGAFLVALAGLALILSACSGSGVSSGDPGGSEAEGGAGSGGEDAGAALQAVYDELEGLEGEERMARLVELAGEETAAFTCYCVLNSDDMAPLSEALDEALGSRARMDHYRANADTILQRLLQEDAAGFAGADVVMLDGPELYAADQEGLLLPLTTPVTENIEGTTDTYAPFVLITYTAFWNTEAISPDEAPTTWEDVFSNYGDRLLWEETDFTWFQTLVTRYFMEEQGMTQEEAVDLFRAGAQGAGVARGHTLMVNMVTAGEFDMGTSGFWFRVARESAEGRPLGYNDPQVVQPLVTDIAGMGVHKSADAPATALLFTELTLGADGQQALADLNFTPSDRSIEAVSAIPPEIEVHQVDLEEIHENRQEWEELYATVTREAGQAG